MCLRRVLVALAASALLGLAIVSPAIAAKDYRADRYDVRLVVEPGGAMVVTETITFALGADTFTYVSRTLPRRRIDGLTILSVTMDGRELSPGDDPGQYDVAKTDNDGRRIRWHFAKTTAATHTFGLSYRVAGVVRQEAAADVLEWHALPTDHEYPIAIATVSLEWPAAAGVIEPPAVDPPVSSAAAGEAAVRFERTGLAKDDPWLVRARFAPRSVASTLPDWQRRARQAQQKLPLFLGLAGMVLLAGVGGFTAFRLNHRPGVPRDPSARQPSAPGDLPLVLGAALAQNGNANWNTALAAILDLARRGVVRIDETEGSLLRKHDFTLTAGGAAAPTRPAERALYDLLFTTKTGSRERVKFSELSGIFASKGRWRRFTDAVKSELRNAGLVDQERERTRGRATVTAVVVLVLGFVALMAAIPFIDEYGGATLMIGAALLASGGVGLAVSQSLTPLTDDALRRAQLWQAHGRYLKDLSKAVPSTTVAGDVVDRVLPYAAAFGVAAAWAKVLKKHGMTAGPTWLHALEARGGEASHLDATVVMLTMGHSAGGSVDHSAGGAAAGAAGGGSSSAG
jgi:hypothetical protein